MEKKKQSDGDSHLPEVLQLLLLAASAAAPGLAAAAEAAPAAAAGAEAGSLEAAAGSQLLSAPHLNEKNSCEKTKERQSNIYKPEAPDCTTWACCWGWG